MLNGREAEKLFAKIAEKRGVVMRSTAEEDMTEHWDYTVDSVKYDVKAYKKLNRWDRKGSDVVWLELTNVRGNVGWLRGKADKIALLTREGFVIVDRKKLLNFALSFVESNTIYTKKEYRRWYRREGRQDVITYVYLDDIKNLVEEI